MGNHATFLVLATALVAVVLAAVLPWVWRSASRHGDLAQGRRRAWLTTTFMVLGLPVVAFGLYGLRGDPAALSESRSGWETQLMQDGLPAAGEASERFHRELEQHLERQPGDARALVLKARLYMRDGHHEQAAAAFEQALAERSKAALDAGVWVEYAEASAMAQGRSLAGEPQRLLHKALEIDGGHAQALDLAGSAAWEEHDYATAAMYWRRLLEQISAEDARHAAIRRAIDGAEKRDRLALPMPPKPPPQ